MTTLSVHNFSSIRDATLEIANITLLIGPQASGKSVLSKLVYFFYEIPDSLSINIADQLSFSRYQRAISEKFQEWFPPTAWGTGRFTIEFTAGDLTVHISGRSLPSGSDRRLQIHFSDAFRSHYEASYQQYTERLQSAERTEPERSIGIDFRLRRILERQTSRILGRDKIDQQIFVPAGRSFFTNFDKAVVAFERGGMLDPITIQFGRLFTTLRERRGRRLQVYQGRVWTGAILDDQQQRYYDELFGGQIRHLRDQDVLVTKDGRTIPFSVLSSGQQELLPLLMTLQYVAGMLSRNDKYDMMMYIEEPEAHLFPTSQGILTEYISSIANSGGRRMRTLITTHSPYLLAKINNLLKAGSLGRKRDKRIGELVAKVLPKETWLAGRSTAAYAIINRDLVPIIDKEGLIDASYLDDVSDDIGRQFTELLDIEMEYAKS